MPGVSKGVEALTPYAQKRMNPHLYISDVPLNTLGVRAVDNYTRIGVAEEQWAGVALSDSQDSELEQIEQIVKGIPSMVDNDLSAVRRKMAELNIGYSADFGRYCDTSVPQFLQDVKAQNAPGSTWAEWLGAKADREQLVNFLQWHTNAVEQTNQNPKVAECVAEQKVGYKDGIRRGIDEGWLHPDAESAIERVDEISIFAGDLFDTSFAHRGGYHFFGTKSVVAAVIKNIYKEGEGPVNVILGLKFATKHELNHAVLAQITKKVRWLNEAVTEHIAQVIDYGQPEVINPYARDSKFGTTYGNERLILAKLLEEGEHKIPASLVTRAYSESGSNELSAFVEAVDESWAAYTPAGESAYTNLNNFINSLERQFLKEGMSEVEAGQKATEITWGLFKKSPQLVFAGKPSATVEPLKIAAIS